MKSITCFKTKQNDKLLVEICRFIWSEWRDLNSRPHGPEPCVLPAAPHPDKIFNCVILPNGNIFCAEVLTALYTIPITRKSCKRFFVLIFPNRFQCFKVKWNQSGTN